MVDFGSDVPCFHPVPALYDGDNVTVRPRPSEVNTALPCGHCAGCKTSRSQEWASRVMHEAREHHSNIFATLTYNDENVHPDGALVPWHLSEFLRDLRKKVLRDSTFIGNPSTSAFPNRLRYLACGEYGDRSGRPHYHAILFGVALADARQATDKLLNSSALEKLWGRGTVNYGEVTGASAAYVAGYTVKSLGKQQHSRDGVVIPPPFLRMSTHPGIGALYADRFATDFRSGSLVVDGSHHRIPRYYRKRIERTMPQLAEEIANAILVRQEQQSSECIDHFGPALDHPSHPARLKASETILLRKQELTRSHSL
ncbi:MAG: replication initiator protein [Microvirus sp.]|nr:MAG: replication initiator protein [Microvirus sp.]